MKPSIVTVGTFDGVHLGHRAVLECLRSRGEALSLRPVAVTFDRHPLEVVAPSRAPGLITDIDRRDDMIRDYGAEVHRVAFTESVRDMKSADWLALLKDELGMKALVVGYDNTFGSDGRGMTCDDYRRLGDALGIEVTEAPYMEGCSSSAVRRALGAGDVAGAAAILGRPYMIEGKVTEGSRIGRTLGVPTANLAVDQRLMLPVRGVYAATAVTSDGGRYAAVVNIGVNPTVTDKKELKVEAHLLGYSGNLYGTRLALEFISRMRDERKFGSLAELKEALHADISARRLCEL